MKHVDDHTEPMPTEARGAAQADMCVMHAVSTVAAAILMGAFWTLTRELTVIGAPCPRNRHRPALTGDGYQALKAGWLRCDRGQGCRWARSAKGDRRQW